VLHSEPTSNEFFYFFLPVFITKKSPLKRELANEMKIENMAMMKKQAGRKLKNRNSAKHRTYILIINSKR